MKHNNKIILLLLLITLNLSCGRNYREEDLTQKIPTKEDSIRMRNEKIEESLVKTNQIVIKKELEKIKSYIERNSWKVIEKNGIFYEIISKSEEKNIFFLCFIFFIQRNISIFATHIQILCKTSKA